MTNRRPGRPRARARDRGGTMAGGQAMTMPRDAAREMAAFAAQEDGPVTEHLPVAPRPALTLSTLIPPTQTVAIDGGIHELRVLALFSVGRQAALINDRNAQLSLRQREEQGEELSEEDAALHRFYLERMARAALPGIPRTQIAAWRLELLEAVATLFFNASREFRETVVAASAPPPISAA